MSTTIRHEIKALEAAGKLIMIRPRSTNEWIVRPMFVTRAIWKMLNEDYDLLIDIKRAAFLQADLEVFVTGQSIDAMYFKRLAPKGKNVWEIRSPRPRPSIRIFGRFAERDVFIATSYSLRMPLGQFNSLQWRNAVHIARQEWNGLFRNHQPVDGKLHELVSGVSNE